MCVGEMSDFVDIVNFGCLNHGAFFRNFTVAVCETGRESNFGKADKCTVILCVRYAIDACAALPGLPHEVLYHKQNSKSMRFAKLYFICFLYTFLSSKGLFHEKRIEKIISAHPCKVMLFYCIK